MPTSITAFTAETLKDYNVQSFTDYATKTPDLSFTYGGGPTGIADARTIAVRGISGQNLFGTAGATGFYIDDTPVPGSLDPRVVDLASIEVLKGPQGTLFGESSLGGNVRLITKQPDLNKSGFGYMADAGITSGGGSADGGGNFIGNLVLVPSTCSAARGAVRQPRRRLSDPYLSHGSQRPRRQVIRSCPFRAPARAIRARSLPAVARRHCCFVRPITSTSSCASCSRIRRIMAFPPTFAPLPEFTPQYTLNRAFDVQSHASDSWTMPTLDLKYSGTGWSLVWANSFFYRHTQDVEDSSYGTQQVLATPFLLLLHGTAGCSRTCGTASIITIRCRARRACLSTPFTTSAAQFGLYYANTHTRFTIPPTYANGLTAPATSATVHTRLAAW